MTLNFSSKTNFATKHEAFAYQKAAVDAIKDLDYAAIFHEQGLGKTKIAIDLMEYWFQKREIDTVLVVTKKQLIKNWENELKDHTYIVPKTLDTNKSNNFYVFNMAVRIVLTNFEAVSSEIKRFKLWLRTRNVAVIIDESTKLKNPDAQLTKNFFDLAPLFKIRVIMTGTPIANRPYDIWSQIYFLDQGRSLGSDFRSFKEKTDLRNDLETNDESRRLFETTVSEIFQKIRSFTVRETKASGLIELPKKNYIPIYLPFEPEQKRIYDEIKDELSLLVQKNNKVVLDDSSEPLKRLLRLIQAASNPRLIDENYSETSAKEKKLQTLLPEILDRNEQVIVWTSYIENVNYFAKTFSHFGVAKIHGSMAIDDRNRSVEKFKKGQAKILFATPQSAKEGLTLTNANNVIFYDRGFNLDDYLQAQDRIHRISQKKDCNIYLLMVAGSIDEWIDHLLAAKQDAAALGQGDIKKSEFKKIIDYSYGDMIKEILGYSEQ